MTEIKAVMLILEVDEPEDRLGFVIGIRSGNLAITESFATMMGTAA